MVDCGSPYGCADCGCKQSMIFELVIYLSFVHAREVCFICFLLLWIRLAVVSPTVAFWIWNCDVSWSFCVVFMVRQSCWFDRSWLVLLRRIFLSEATRAR